MSIIVHMVFSKEHIRNFAFTLSEDDQVLRFKKRDKLNSLVRSYLHVSPKNFFPQRDPDATKIIVPVDSRIRNYPSLEYLPERNYKLLERDFEDLFFSIFHAIDSAGLLSNGKRKEAREKFLASCNITSDDITQDAFRKQFDRFRKKKEAQISLFLENPEFDLVTFYKSGRKNFTHKTLESVQH